MTTKPKCLRKNEKATWLEARREGGQSRDSLNLAGVELTPKRYDDIGTGTQTLRHTNQWGGRRPSESNSDGHSLNLATRRAPAGGELRAVTVGRL